jgi:hypothetical protein
MAVIGAVPALAVSADLGDYPEMFITMGKFNGFIVVGDRAPASDVVAAVDIARSINAYRTGSPGDEGTVPVGSSKLASEVPNPKDLNIISIGHPCVNPVTSSLMGDPKDCEDAVPDDRGIIKLYNYNGKLQMVVAGYDNDNTRMGAGALSRWEDYNMEGDLLYVWGTSLDDVVLIHPGDYDDYGYWLDDEDDYEEEDILPPQPELYDEEDIAPEPDSSCPALGIRSVEEGTPSYCDVDGEYSEQKDDGESCQNNYETMNA